MKTYPNLPAIPLDPRPKMGTAFLLIPSFEKRKNSQNGTSYPCSAITAPQTALNSSRCSGFQSS
jgi:hypothetical protein